MHACTFHMPLASALGCVSCLEYLKLHLYVGCTALMCAVYLGNTGVMNQLLKAKADPNLREVLVRARVYVRICCWV